MRITNIKNRNEERTTAQIFWSIFPALVIANIIPAFSTVINGLIVGNAYSEAAMSAISFAGPVVKLTGAFAMLVSSGAGIVYGHCLGRGDSEKIHKVFTADICIILVIGLFLTLVGELFTDQIVLLIGAAGEPFSETVSYLRGLFIGIIPTLMMPGLISFLNLGNEAKYGMFSSAVLAGVNLILGLINVHVIKGGMFGAGLVSAISGYAAVLFLFIRFAKRKELGHIVRISGDLHIIRDIILLGIPVSVSEIGVSLRNMIINAESLKAAGTAATAAMGILLSSAGFFCAVMPAVVEAASTIVSITAGEGNAQLLKKQTAFLIKKGAQIYIITGLIYAFFAPQISVIFGAEGAGINYGTMCIRIYCLELFIEWFGDVLFAVHRSLGRSAFAIVLHLLITFVYPVVSLFVLRGPFGITGIWLCYGSAVLFGSITFILHAGIKGRKIPSSVGDLLWLDDSFDVPQEDRFSITVNTMEDVVRTAASVQNFCLERGIDSRRAFLMALCLEEMAGNTVLHGFSKASVKKRKKLVIDISVAVRDGKVSAGIRDNAPQFDPFQKLEMYRKNEEDPCKNIGIRMVSGFAKEMKYQSTLGMNVLTVEI